MRRQLMDNTLTLISALCVFQILWDILDDIQKTEDRLKLLVKIVIIILIVLIIWYQIYYKKRLIFDTFDMLKNLSQNNKLHTLREVVMVVNDQYEKNINKYKIERAVF